MRISKDAKQLADDLGLSDIDAYMMDLKAKLYDKCAELISESELTHEQIAKMVGTSRARINRISNMGENSISMELLIKISTLLANKAPLKLAI
ncbi:helix-turn-helix transcriptional regulator [Halobacteriovorax sp. GB3]|uniref:helix-turn-helix domain-containing protein n=1 Tax=Halobacteriovorax sp. GB3 TaxID=2719615 RepID=UPI00235ED0DA|nr:helix-turn-helix transcriptional regulator [Halobacteriovorax sp. GB3]MDD0852112.1 helix-turn-helix transcriptional regulator [Halobacteriovorax sp. GB3]